LPAGSAGQLRGDARQTEAERWLRKAIRAGWQEDREVEERRQFRIGYAAGLLGLVRFHEVLQSCQRRR